MAYSDKVLDHYENPRNVGTFEDGDHVVCAISGKEILIKNLTYWNVEKQEAYFSYKEAFLKREKDLKS